MRSGLQVEQSRLLLIPPSTLASAGGLQAHCSVVTVAALALQEGSKLNTPEKSGVSSGTGELADDAGEDETLQV